MSRRSFQIWMILALTLVACDKSSGPPSMPPPPPPPTGFPDPTLLPVATTSQAPLTTAYNALNVPAVPAGGSYLDPTTGVKVYKITSATFPTSSANWGHDYAEGGDEVSLPYTGTTRAVLVHGRSEERRVGKECRSRWSADH